MFINYHLSFIFQSRSGKPLLFESHFKKIPTFIDKVCFYSVKTVNTQMYKCAIVNSL